MLSLLRVLSGLLYELRNESPQKTYEFAYEALEVGLPWTETRGFVTDGGSKWKVPEHSQ
jgi:hypothetical protein